MSRTRADLFCRVIDNLGDIGVMWRLARQLSAEKNWSIRLWVDDMNALTRLLPGTNADCPVQHHQGVTICHWSSDASDQHMTAAVPHEVVIAGFSCALPTTFMDKMCRPTPPIWIQLEYLSAEPWVRDFHGHTSVRADGLAPVFFFPGFESGTGGLLRETTLLKDRDHWQSDLTLQLNWLNSVGITLTPTARQATRLISVFAYPDAPIDQLWLALAQSTKPSILLIPGDASFHRLPKDFGSNTHIRWQPIPFLSQPDYDRLLWSTDLNIVRGEDSFVRAIWAKRPFIWHIYPQAARAHMIKLNAWLARTSLPNQVQTALRQWVTEDQWRQLGSTLGQSLDTVTWSSWQTASQQLSHALAQLPDLATGLDRIGVPSQLANR